MPLPPPPPSLSLCSLFPLHDPQPTPIDPQGETYLYNFDLAQPGEDSSADLSVGSGPSSDAQAFICGEETAVEPEEEEQLATPAPIPAPEEPEEETPAPLSPVRGP